MPGARRSASTAPGSRREAREWESGDAPAIERLAKLSAEGLAPLLQEDEAPVEAAAAGRTRVAIRDIRGAPGGWRQIAGGRGGDRVAAAGSAIVENGQPADLTIDGEVSVNPGQAEPAARQDPLRVHRGNGRESAGAALTYNTRSGIGAEMARSQKR